MSSPSVRPKPRHVGHAPIGLLKLNNPGVGAGSVIQSARVTAILLAEMIAQNAPLAVRAAKQALWESEGLPERSAQRVVQRRRRTLDTTRDYSEGLSAFAERRVPRFTGK